MVAIRKGFVAVLALACLFHTAVGFATPPTQAILNALTNQNTINLEANEKNPYGLAAITFNKGKLVNGNFLATNWNDADNNPGQGHTILQVTPQGQVTPFATINTQDPKVTSSCGNQGVGLTMALVVLSKGYVIVGSTPIPVGNTVAGPGCLILLDSNGNLLDAHASNEKTTSNTMTGGGPWAMAVTEYNNGANANLFVSYVLGANPQSTDTLTGAQGGMVVRYGLQLPGGSITPNFWGNAPDVVASGFPTQPGNIGGGAVGPAGLLLGRKVKNSPYNNYLGKQPLFISNLLNNSVDVVEQPTQCFTQSGASPQCKLQVVAWAGLINQPIGLGLSPYGTIVGANGGIGYLFEIAPTKGANTQLAAQLVDNTNANADTVAGAGNLFNVLFHPNSPNTLFFNDDNFNSFNTLTLPTGSTGRKMMARM